MYKIILSAFIVFGHIVSAQFFTSSNLPVVVINTDGNEDIEDDPRVNATMKIINRTDGKRNAFTDKDSTLYLNYNGRIDIEIRGSSSQLLPKKPYALTTRKADGSNNNVSLLGMPAENDWVLNSCAFDSSMMRDFLSYELGRRLGHYAPRTVYCELIINNSYMGLYLLQEKIKANSNRVDIVKMEASDTSGSKLTGGYITKVDKVANDDIVAWYWSSDVSLSDLNFQHESPKPTEVANQQNTYIKGEFDRLAAAVAQGNSSITTGYPSIIDIPSFVDYMIMNEFSANVDGYQFSSYFHKDRRGRLRAGPLWDFNLTYGNDLTFWALDRSKTNTWQFDNGDNEGPKFWKQLYNDPVFNCYFSKRWFDLSSPGMPLDLASISTLLDITAARIQEAVSREKALWGNINVHAAHVRKIKRFLTARSAWITSKAGDYMNCIDINNPALVITKIMYNPSNSQKEEFIEIKNNGTTTASLTGIYFSNMGMGYQFPVGAELEAGKTLVLASDEGTYKAVYGSAPFGEYARNLSNAGQTITLSDAYGNVIDHVDFSDKSPWPDADGNGNYLELKSPDLDNNEAQNWMASTVLAVESHQTPMRLDAYPTPTRGLLHWHTSQNVIALQLVDALGNILHEEVANAQEGTLQLHTYPSGMYLVKFLGAQHTAIRKVIKE